ALVPKAEVRSAVKAQWGTSARLVLAGSRVQPVAKLAQVLEAEDR
ncbi:hypothetical protein PR003_g1412, partial [Phytophthora rubi]